MCGGSVGAFGVSFSCVTLTGARAGPGFVVVGAGGAVGDVDVNREVVTNGGGVDVVVSGIGIGIGAAMLIAVRSIVNWTACVVNNIVPKPSGEC